MKPVFFISGEELYAACLNAASATEGQEAAGGLGQFFKGCSGYRASENMNIIKGLVRVSEEQSNPMWFV